MNRIPSVRDSNGLSLDQIRVSAPSAFATKAHSRMSDRYAFVSTIELIRPLLDSGFRVVEAGQRATRARDPKFTRHMLKLRSVHAKPIVGDTFPELVVTNSHDGQSIFQILAGLFRLVCSNGMVTSIGDTAAFAKAHRGDAAEIFAKAQAVAVKGEGVRKVIEAMAKKKLNEAAQVKLAIASAKVAYEKPNFDPKLLLNVRRTQDEGSDVWSVFNRIQENIISGGVHFESRASHRRFQTRGITHIGRNLEVNRGLWSLAEALVA